MSRKDAPAAGQAPLPAADAAALLAPQRHRSRPSATGPRCGSATGRGRTPSTSPSAHAVREAVPRARCPTAGAARTSAVLLDNTPDYLFALGGAALVGAAVVGLNHTRRGEHLLRDIEHTALRAGDHRAPARARCSSRSPTGLPDRCSSSTAIRRRRRSRPSLGPSLDDALGGRRRRRPRHRARTSTRSGR